ncbi:MAG: TIGR03862 family flavoprotein [Akkermansiaceae bacterium]|nr:TIGR03862 family flavoprotein [Akkermansiaceae bacterium]
MAAESAATLGAQVTVYDAMRSVGRKFLVAGKSGLNLTNAEAIDPFLAKYSGHELPRELWRDIIANFDNNALRKWAADLGVDTFVASSGKVFPSPIDGSIKAAPLLRRWVGRLRTLGVSFKTKHRWIGLEKPHLLTFDHGGEIVTVHADATILALGGASWPQTGSDGHWTQTLAGHGIDITPLTAANCGWEVDWPVPLLEEAEGQPLKNLLLQAGGDSRHGELVITRYGLEGGPIYRLGPAIRQQSNPHVIIDFKPDLSHADLVARMGRVTRNFVREARRRWKLDAATCSMLKYMPDRGPWKSVEQLAHEIKHCHIPLTRPRPIDEAISSAGGIRWKELDESLMLKKLPGVFAAGEMIDWEAPTGGYLLQASFATGAHVGRNALNSRF